MISVKIAFYWRKEDFYTFFICNSTVTWSSFFKKNPNSSIISRKSSETNAISIDSIARGRISSYFPYLCWNSIAVGKTVFSFAYKFKPNIIKLVKKPYVKIDMGHRFNYVLNKAHYLITWNHILLPIVVFVLCVFYCARVQLVTVYVVIRTVMWQGEQWKNVLWIPANRK